MEASYRGISRISNTKICLLLSERNPSIYFSELKKKFFLIFKLHILMLYSIPKLFVVIYTDYIIKPFCIKIILTRCVTFFLVLLVLVMCFIYL